MNSRLGKSILIVDDDVQLCAIISDFLSKHDYQINACHNGEDAIARIDEDAPDLVVLDLMLPGVDGLIVCREVRVRNTGLILMLTALRTRCQENVCWFKRW